MNMFIPTGVCPICVNTVVSVSSHGISFIVTVLEQDTQEPPATTVSYTKPQNSLCLFNYWDVSLISLFCSTLLCIMYGLFQILQMHCQNYN